MNAYADDMPLTAVLGIACVNDTVKGSLESLLQQRGIELTVKAMPKWYF